MSACALGFREVVESLLTCQQVVEPLALGCEIAFALRHQRRAD
jgi:hypothetical protein